MSKSARRSTASLFLHASSLRTIAFLATLLLTLAAHAVIVRGTVTKSWARLHHPRWYREVTGEQPRS